MNCLAIVWMRFTAGQAGWYLCWAHFQGEVVKGCCELSCGSSQEFISLTHTVHKVHDIGGVHAHQVEVGQRALRVIQK